MVDRLDFLFGGVDTQLAKDFLRVLGDRGSFLFEPLDYWNLTSEERAAALNEWSWYANEKSLPDLRAELSMINKLPVGGYDEGMRKEAKIKEITGNINVLQFVAVGLGEAALRFEWPWGYTETQEEWLERLLSQAESVGDGDAGSKKGKRIKGESDRLRTAHFIEWVSRTDYDGSHTHYYLQAELRQDKPNLWGKNEETFNKWIRTDEAMAAKELLDKLKLQARQAV